jgi:hypothetical protein
MGAAAGVLAGCAGPQSTMPAATTSPAVEDGPPAQRLFGWPDGAVVNVQIAARGERSFRQGKNDWDMNGSVLWVVQSSGDGFTVDQIEGSAMKGKLAPADMTIHYVLALARRLRFSREGQVTEVDGPAIRAAAAQLFESLRGLPHHEDNRLHENDDARLLAAVRFVFDKIRALLGQARAGDGRSESRSRLPFPDFGGRLAEVLTTEERATGPCPVDPARRCRRITRSILPDVADTSRIYAETWTIDRQLKGSDHRLLREMTWTASVDLEDERLVSFETTEKVEESSIDPGGRPRGTTRKTSFSLLFATAPPRAP